MAHLYKLLLNIQASNAASDEENNREPLVDKKKKTKDLNRQMNKKLLKTKAFKRQTQMVRDKSRKKGKHLRKTK